MKGRRTFPCIWSGLVASLIGLELLFGVARAQDAGSHKTQISFEYSSPEVGGALMRETDGQLVFKTFSVGVGPRVPSGMHCPKGQWTNIDVVTEGWLKLTLAVPPNERVAFSSWLDARSQSETAMTNRELFNRTWRGLQAGFDALSAGLGRPGELRFVIRHTPADCEYVEEIPHSARDARRLVVFPVAVHSPGLLGEASTRIVESIVEIAAHETTHVLNFYPFDDERLRWLLAGPAVAPHDPLRPTSMDAEVRAVLVERCLRRLVMPRSEEMESQAREWRHQRSQFDLKVAAEPTLKIWSEAFQREYEVLGAGFSTARSDLEMRRLLTRCAMYVQRRSEVHGATQPNKREMEAGATALANVRRVTMPIKFLDRQYDE